jgi:hypothetical protein
MPKDLSVYQDICMKVYQHYKGIIDYVELGNELNGVNARNNWSETPGPLCDAGSPYSTFDAAFNAVYKAFADGIRSVDPNIPLGGPALGDAAFSDGTGASHLAALLENNFNNVNFFSFHVYGRQTATSDDHFGVYQNTAVKKGKSSSFMTFMDEWGVGGDPVPAEDREGIEALPYVGLCLTKFYMENAAGANIYRFDRAQFPSDKNYHSLNQDGSPTYKCRTWRLLARQLGLSAGDGSVKGASYSGVPIAGAAVNSTGVRVAWLITRTAINAKVTFKGLPDGSYSAQVYEASGSNDATSVRQTINFQVNGERGDIRISAPANSVVGIEDIRGM